MMNRQQYLGLHEALCNEARLLSERKNHDYAGKGGEQVFANFERTEAMGICSTERGFLVRMTDKFSRLSSFEESGEFKVKDESVRDTILDIINYAVLYYAYKQDKTQAAPKRFSPYDALVNSVPEPSQPKPFNGWDVYDTLSQSKAVSEATTPQVKYPQVL